MRLSFKSSFLFLITGLILISLPLTVYLTKQRQEVRSRAATTAELKSKLGIQTSFERVPNDEVIEFIIAAQPKVVKLLNGFERASEIKQKSPNSFIVGRIYDANFDDQNIDNFIPQESLAESKAQEWLTSNNKTSIIQSNPSVDCWEGPNEPGVFNDIAMKKYARFEIRRVQLLTQMGRKACVGAFSVGNPGNMNLWPYFYDAIREAKNNNGYLTLHEYSAPNLQCLFDSGSGEGWLTGRYRKVYKNYLIPNNLSIPLIISEIAIDGGTCGQCPCQNKGSQNNGWRSYTDSLTYINELKWYDSILKQDSYVIGATIFILGRSDWNSFEIYPELTGNDGRSGPLTEYIRGEPVPSIPTPTPFPCTVSFNLSDNNPPPNTTITVKITGINDPKNWQYIRLLLDGKTDNITWVKIEDPFPTFVYTINSGNTGNHTLNFTVNNGARTCTPSKSFTSGTITTTTPTVTPTPTKSPTPTPNLGNYGDNILDLSDYNVWLSCFHKTAQDLTTACAKADVNDDGKNDIDLDPGRNDKNNMQDYVWFTTSLKTPYGD